MDFFRSFRKKIAQEYVDDTVEKISEKTEDLKQIINDGIPSLVGLLIFGVGIAGIIMSGGSATVPAHLRTAATTQPLGATNYFTFYIENLTVNK